MTRLCWRLGTQSPEEVRKNFVAALAEAICARSEKTRGEWTESLAVGSHEFVERIQPQIHSRSETELEETADEVWALKEGAIPYTAKPSPKIARKA